MSGLARTRLARSVHDAGWSQLLRLMGKKQRRTGARRPDRPVRAHQPGVLSLRGQTPRTAACRQWTSRACGTVLARDVNAARNILAAGRADNENACGAGADHTLWQPARKQGPTGARREPRCRNPRRHAGRRHLDGAVRRPRRWCARTPAARRPPAGRRRAPAPPAAVPPGRPRHAARHARSCGPSRRSGRCRRGRRPLRPGLVLRTSRLLPYVTTSHPPATAVLTPSPGVTSMKKNIHASAGVNPGSGGQMPRIDHRGRLLTTSEAHA